MTQSIYTHRNVHDFNPDWQDIVTSDTTACTTISVRQQKPEFLCGFGDDCKTLFTVPTNCSNAQQGQTSIFNFHSKLFIRENTLLRKRSGKNDHQTLNLAWWLVSFNDVVSNVKLMIICGGNAATSGLRHPTWDWSSSGIVTQSNLFRSLQRKAPSALCY